MQVGKTIRLLRVAAGIPQKQLASKLEISPSYLNLIEKDEREPSISVLRRVSRHLGVPISALLFEASLAPDNATVEQQEDYQRIRDLFNSALTRLMLLKESHGTERRAEPVEESPNRD